MESLRPFFIAHLVIVILSSPLLLIVVVLLSSNSTMPIAFFILGASLFYILATIWLPIYGKKNRLTAGIVMAMALVLLTIFLIDYQRTQKSHESGCIFTKTQCAKLDTPNNFHCRTSNGRGITGTKFYVAKECIPTLEESCAYAKRFCRPISRNNSLKTHYACTDRDIITCP